MIFTLVPVLCCLLVAYLENSPLPEKLRGTFLEKGICGISSIGYSVYLVHYIVFQMVAPYGQLAGLCPCGGNQPCHQLSDLSPD